MAVVTSLILLSLSTVDVGDAAVAEAVARTDRALRDATRLRENLVL